MADPMDIVVLGLTITSFWGHGHATTYRAIAVAKVVDRLYGRVNNLNA